MKENKTVQIKFRLTQKQKEQVESYAAYAGLNTSEVMRLAVEELLRGGKYNVSPQLEDDCCE